MATIRCADGSGEELLNRVKSSRMLIPVERRSSRPLKWTTLHGQSLERIDLEEILERWTEYDSFAGSCRIQDIATANNAL